jgi:hypothetical protein
MSHRPALSTTLISSLVLFGIGIGFGIGWGVNDLVETSNCITTADIDRAQKAWGDAFISIGDAWNEKQCTGALDAANAALDAAYSFERPLLFKPTLTMVPHTFRSTREGALSYFIGSCAPVVIGNDKGFALGFSAGDPTDITTWKGFTSVRFTNMTYHTGGDYCNAAVAEGKMYFSSRLNGEEYSVDKTLVYKPNPESGGIPLLTVHHSSD